ncbi:MAG: type II toxin-antitoxin system VapC family toxin [Candidatus Dormibacteria bacterium]
MTTPRCVVDASAVLAWIFDEHGSDAVEKVLSVSALSTVNLAEVLYRADEDGMQTDRLEQDLRDLGVQIEPFVADDAVGVKLIRRQSRKKNLGLSLADCCCIATAQRLGVQVVGGDRAWDALDLDVEIQPFR